MPLLQFEFAGHSCLLNCPETPAPGKPWVWRAEFPFAFTYADQALLDRGWHVAYCDLQDQYGCEYAIGEMKRFHDHLVSEYGLADKAAIFGFSRGGLYTFNYALAHPEDLHTVYLDAPVLDIKSWPGGLGSSECCPKEWAECLACYGLTEETVRTFKGNPLDNIDRYLALGLPTILIAGDSDTVVPYPENGRVLEKALVSSSLHHLVGVKPGVGHHPHSLEDPTPIVDFILAQQGR